MKKLLLVFITCFSIFFTPISSVFASEKGEQIVNDIQINKAEIESNLREYLKNMDEDKKIEFLNQFNTLSDNDKEKFLSYVNSSDFMLSIFESMKSNSSNGKVILNDGDIVINSIVSNENTDMISQNQRDEQCRTARYVHTFTFLGVELFQYTATIIYSHDGRVITEIESGNAYMSKNFIPLINFTWNAQKSFGVGTKYATHIGYCTCSLIHPKVGMQMFTHEVGVIGDVNNNTTGWVY